MSYELNYNIICVLYACKQVTFSIAFPRISGFKKSIFSREPNCLQIRNYNNQPNSCSISLHFLNLHPLFPI
jgi:hypothetical protein